MSTTVPSDLPREGATVDRLALALFIATAFHALIILGISFNPLDQDNRDQPLPTLDITVVNPSPTPPPEDYDYLAEKSQDGAGNTEQKVRPQQQMLKQAPPVAPPQATPEATRLLTSRESTAKTRAPEQTTPERKTSDTSATELINRSMEMLALNQQINQSLQAYSKTPKSRFISARTREYKYASYMRDWVAKVERVGELNYPDAARRQHLSGKLIVQVALYPDGSVREITIRKHSGHKILDDAAVRIVKLAAPFAPFPEEIRKETDILYITRTWIFTSGNRLESR
ncbi:MAG TPA: energy transducer TonB [Gammaproteobacteria bacterium]|nr:energy transducer TonB [Gammaproteobacteria bacterium]